MVLLVCWNEILEDLRTVTDYYVKGVEQQCVMELSVLGLTTDDHGPICKECRMCVVSEYIPAVQSRTYYVARDLT